MVTSDKRVDVYINRQAVFAKPILTHLRRLVHDACPQATETIKWGMPYYDYKGLFFSMAAFKQHCSFGFRKASLMKDAALLLANNKMAMGNGGRITSLNDLPPEKTLLRWLKEAAALNDTILESAEKAKRAATARETTGDFFLKELKKSKAALHCWKSASPSFRKAYEVWVMEAKTLAIRQKRMHQAIERITEGKSLVRKK